MSLPEPTRHLLAIAALALTAAPALAQFEVSDAQAPPFDAERLIRDVLLGDGVEVLSVRYDGKPSAIGYFKGGAGPVGLDEGIVLTTGRVASSGAGSGIDATSAEFAQLKNGSGVYDVDLDTIAPPISAGGGSVVRDTIYDVARYTITFVPKGDKLRFRYVFASEEYPEFVCSKFNDIFGFFISGPGFSGPYENGGVNIALVPGTSDPVRINSINPGVSGSSDKTDDVYCTAPEGSLANAAYYRDNVGTGQQPVFDGMTTVLTAEADVQPCETYTIKLAIGDVSDGSYDSGVFFEAKSFSTQILTLDVATASLKGELAEACAPGELIFRLSEPAAADFPVTYTTSGVAIPGIDYEPLPGALVIPAGQQEVRVPINVYPDGVAEGPERLIIDVAADVCATKHVEIDLVDQVIVPVPLRDDTTVCPGTSVQLDARLPLPTDAELTFTGYGSFVTYNSSPSTSDIPVSGVSPAALRDGVIARVCVSAATLNDQSRTDALDAYLFAPNGNFVELSTDNGGAGPGGYEQVCFTATAPQRIDAVGVTGPIHGGVPARVALGRPLVRRRQGRQRDLDPPADQRRQRHELLPRRVVDHLQPRLRDRLRVEPRGGPVLRRLPRPARLARRAHRVHRDRDRQLRLRGERRGDDRRARRPR